MPYCPLGHPMPYDALACPECGLPAGDAAKGDEDPTLAPDTPAERIGLLASGLRRGAGYLEAAAILAALAGVAVGIILMFTTSRDGYDTTHPFIGLGVVVAASSLFAGLFNWCAARALHIYAEHTALSCSVDLDDI